MASPLLSFQLPPLPSNAAGWGPAADAATPFQDLPYQLFSKNDRVGKAADFTGLNQARPNRFQAQFGAGDAHAYFQEEDDSAFQLVDSGKTASALALTNSALRSGMRRWQSQARVPRKDAPRGREEPRRGGANATAGGNNANNSSNNSSNNNNNNAMGGGVMSAAAKTRERERQRQERQWQARNSGRGRTQVHSRGAASVEVRAEWGDALHIVEMNRITSAPRPYHATAMASAVDLAVAGSLAPASKAHERLTARTAVPLSALADRTAPRDNALYRADPIMERLAAAETAPGTVFASDAVLAMLMAGARPQYSWDLVARRVGDRLFLERRRTDPEHQTVDESVPPEADGPELNTPASLAREATLINLDYKLQALGSAPAFTPVAAGATPAVGGKAYRYRKFDLGNGQTYVVRCALDARTPDNSGYAAIWAFNEWNSAIAMPWRRRNPGEVFADVLHRNQAKVARWTASALLGGASELRFGFVSRATPNDATRHEVLHAAAVKPAEFAAQITFDADLGWTIVAQVVSLLLAQPDGKYLLLKDPAKPAVAIYRVRPETFEAGDRAGAVEENLEEAKEEVQTSGLDMTVVLTKN